MELGDISAHQTIVLEGCDGAGKSTLATRLASGYGFAVVHSSRTPYGVDLAERYRQKLARPERLVLDRSFISELVCGPLRHGGSRISDADARDLAVAVARGHHVRSVPADLDSGDLTVAPWALAEMPRFGGPTSPGTPIGCRRT